MDLTDFDNTSLINELPPMMICAFRCQEDAVVGIGKLKALFGDIALRINEKRSDNNVFSLYFTNSIIDHRVIKSILI